jgi:hypothetical protein
LIGVVKHTTVSTAYFRCLLLDESMQESLHRAKFLFRFAPATGRAPTLEEPMHEAKQMTMA